VCSVRAHSGRMTPRLNPLLTDRDLPTAELCGARLDGEVFALGDGWCCVDEVPAEAVRAQAAALLVKGRAIAERMTAAWIFGLVPEPQKHQFCVDAAHRAHVRLSSRLQLREVICSPADILILAGLRVTTPLRTIIDLARHAPDGVQVVPVVAALLAYGDVDHGLADDRIRSQPRAGHTRLARLRLSEAEQLRRAG
jgi:hypothetical protein